VGRTLRAAHVRTHARARGSGKFPSFAKSAALAELVEWSYPRNWGSFVWNEEGRSEYTLSPYLFPWLAA